MMQSNYANRADFEALCETLKEQYKSTSETIQLEKVMREMYTLLYCIDDLGSGASIYNTKRASQYANAGTKLADCLEYMQGILSEDLQK